MFFVVFTLCSPLTIFYKNMHIPLRSEKKLNTLNKTLHHPKEGKQYLVLVKC